MNLAATTISDVKLVRLLPEKGSCTGWSERPIEARPAALRTRKTTGFVPSVRRSPGLTRFALHLARREADTIPEIEKLLVNGAQWITCFHWDPLPILESRRSECEVRRTSVPRNRAVLGWGTKPAPPFGIRVANDPLLFR